MPERKPPPATPPGKRPAKKTAKKKAPNRPNARKGGKDGINPREIEREYGFAYRFFKSNPELWKLLKTAVAEGYDVSKFQAHLKATKWYKRHSDVWRQMTALKYSDPRTYQERMNNMRTQIKNLAGQWGADLTPGELKRYTTRALMFGWSPDQILDHIAKDVRPGKDGHFDGQLSGIEAQLKETAFANGVQLNSKQMTGWMRQIVRGDADPREFETYVRDIAAKTFPVFGSQIKAGMNVADLAAPYINSMANILELNPGSLSLFDKTIRGALTGVKDDKGNLTTIGLADFEDQLRADKRWQFTDQAKDQMRGYAIALGKAWGILS